MTLQRPDAQLTLDGRALGAAEAALESVRVDLGVGGAHDRFRARLGLLSKFLDVAPGAAAEVQLGYKDGLRAVLTGTVTSVERTPTGVVVEGHAATAALSAARLGRAYRDQSVADIVSDLVSGAGGTTGEVTGSTTLAAHHVDERRSVWEHLRRLAQLTGSELSADGVGAVNFRPVKTGSADHTLRHGAHVLAWQVGPRESAAAHAVTVVPYGAASEEGADKWHLVLREPEGSSPTETVLIPPQLRSRDAAQALQDALSAARTRAGTRGALVAVGDAELRAGDLVELADMPSGEDGVLRATAVVHVLAAGAGFRTALRLEGAA